MVRTLTLLVALALAAPASANEYAQQRARALYGQLQDRAQCEAALPAAREFRRNSDFSTLTSQGRVTLLQEMMQCALRLGDYDAAIVFTQEARTLGASWGDFSLFVLGASFDRDAAAIEGLHATAQSAPARLAHMPWRFAWNALRAARDLDPSGAEELRVHDVLERLPYEPEDGGTDDGLRVDHALLLLEAGQADRARARVSTVISPRQIMIMRVDRRFDALRSDAVFVGRLDVRAAAEANLVRVSENAQNDPANLHRFLEVAQALRTLGRNEEALALLDQHIAHAQSVDSSYRDVAESLNWLLNERAYILYDLNRPDEAREAFGLSIAARESGAWNVSQVINFATMLISEQRSRDALEVVRTVGASSPYGDMWIAAVRVCAAAQLGDAALQATSIAFLREHAEDNISALARASLCVNDLDAAAALYIQRLNDPDKRSSALLALQRYESSPVEALPYDTVLRQRMERVRERPDVQAAVAEFGRIEHVPLRAVYWGDL
jgi:tetratricopeptide (TPR) repeat protein